MVEPMFLHYLGQLWSLTPEYLIRWWSYHYLNSMNDGFNDSSVFEEMVESPFFTYLGKFCTCGLMGRKVEWEEGHLSGVLVSSMSVSSWEEHDWDPLLAYEKPWGQQKHVTISSEKWSGNFGKRGHNRHYRNIASIISSTWVFSCLCLNSCCSHLGSLQTNYPLNICDKW